MVKIKQNYIIIPLITILVAVIGSWFTSIGMSWYDIELIKPSITPPKYIFPIAWNIIFILTTVSALLVWNSKYFEERYFLFFKRKVKDFDLIISLFIANAILNVSWSLIFFAYQMILPALIEMVFLEITIIALIALIWKHSKPASLLLIPYLLWVGFATSLTYILYTLN